MRGGPGEAMEGMELWRGVGVGLSQSQVPA